MNLTNGRIQFAIVNANSLLDLNSSRHKFVFFILNHGVMTFKELLAQDSLTCYQKLDR